MVVVVVSIVTAVVNTAAADDDPIDCFFENIVAAIHGFFPKVR